MTAARSPGARRLFDGSAWHHNAALALDGGRVAGVVPAEPEAALLVPGLVDLQVNGGGGVQFNDAPTAAAIAVIAAAHRAAGTTSILVTLISDTASVTAAALAAVAEAQAAGQPALAGLHLEGPHLSREKKGTHAADLIRPMEDADLDRILAGAPASGHLLVTVAPEAVTHDQIARMAAAGITVSLGHSPTGTAAAHAAIDAGATMVTHLFNAMSQLGHRAPGLVGAALEDGRVSCGLIADGHHVDPVAMRIALRAKAGPGRIFLVSDAMATVGSDLTEITLNGRSIHRRGGRLTLADGTLAGADIALLDAVRYCRDVLDLPLDEALRMASLYPADAIGLRAKGRLTPGADADYLMLDDDLSLAAVHTAARATEAA